MKRGRCSLEICLFVQNELDLRDNMQEQNYREMAGYPKRQ